MTEPDRLEIIVYTRGWVNDRAMEEGDLPNALLHGRVFLNGNEVPQVLSFQLETKGAEFAKAIVQVTPSSVEVRALTREEWEAL